MNRQILLVTLLIVSACAEQPDPVLRFEEFGKVSDALTTSLATYLDLGLADEGPIYFELGGHDAIRGTLEHIREAGLAKVPKCDDGSLAPTAFGGLRPGGEPGLLAVDVRINADCDDVIALEEAAEFLPFVACEPEGTSLACELQSGASLEEPYLFPMDWPDYGNLNRFAVEVEECEGTWCPYSLHPIDDGETSWEVVTVEVSTEVPAVGEIYKREFVIINPSVPEDFQ